MQVTVEKIKQAKWDCYVQIRVLKIWLASLSLCMTAYEFIVIYALVYEGFYPFLKTLLVGLYFMFSHHVTTMQCSRYRLFFEALDSVKHDIQNARPIIEEVTKEVNESRVLWLKLIIEPSLADEKSRLGFD